MSLRRAYSLERSDLLEVVSVDKHKLGSPVLTHTKMHRSEWKEKPADIDVPIQQAWPTRTEHEEVLAICRPTPSPLSAKEASCRTDAQSIATLSYQHNMSLTVASKLAP